MKDEFEQRIAAEVGASVKAWRLKRSLSQDQLAERLDVGPEAISRMERGVVMLTIPKLVELANVLDCPVEAFIPQASGSTLSGANELAQMLKPLSKQDAQFVVELLGKVSAHLARE
ncbi:helix-turn-helix transcriptional regulator [Azonexus sp.]|uniref:helix-turn-helix domain-containing protein n=1 Tax=Azonexus sp. TaxID=1872668 RepID=UPI00282266F2|nr:helix-turn-helix transcriptional regulator [Azonexus sp.]MDR1994902.1 helix-turn-helix domain-containing protein [Azonexus sp.]